MDLSLLVGLRPCLTNTTPPYSVCVCMLQDLANTLSASAEGAYAILSLCSWVCFQPEADGSDPGASVGYHLASAQALEVGRVEVGHVES